jgi:predicted histone-like DNA-binding protein
MGHIIFNAQKQKIGFNKKVAYVIKPFRYSTLSDEDVAQMASDDSGITVSQIEQCLAALEKQIRQLVLNGHSIMLGPLGSLRFSESAKSVEDKEDYSVDLIKRRRILFKPSKKLMQEIRKVKKTIVVDEVEEP